MSENNTSETGTENVAGPQLLSIVERIEKVDEEMADLKDGRKQILSEAKGNGFDTKVIRRVLARRKLDREELEEAETLVELYERAIKEASA